MKKTITFIILLFLLTLPSFGQTSFLGKSADETIGGKVDCTPVTSPSNGYVWTYRSGNDCGDWDVAGAGTSLDVDLGDDGINETTALTKIAPDNDTNGIFTVVTNVLKADISKNWPTCDVAEDVTGELSLDGVSGTGKVVCVKSDGNLGTCAAASITTSGCTCE